MELKLIAKMLLLCVVTLFSLCCFGDNVYPQEKNNLPARAPKGYTTFVYNKEFAQRFGFDVSKARELTKGLFAVRYKMYVPPNQLPEAFTPYTCSVDLFISSKMDVNYPEGDAPAGDFGTLNKQMAFSTNNLAKISPADSETYAKFDRAYNGLRFYLTFRYLTPKEQARYQGSAILLDSYRRNMLPGIAVLHFVPGCESFAVMKKGAAFWLGKKNAQYAYKSKSGEYLYKMSSYNIVPLPISEIFQQYAKFGYCINDNLNVDDGRKFYPKLYKNYRPDPDCYAFLPKTRKTP